MSDPYVGEIRSVGFNFAPVGWAFCNGAILPINQYEVLFTLIGTTYGGDGQSTFALPDLQGRAPVHQGTLSGGSTYTIGTKGGEESVTLTTNQIPAHTHSIAANALPGGLLSPESAFLAGGATASRYVSDPPATPMSDGTVGLAGGSQPHENRQPLLCVNFIIAFQGIFPSQS